jgi:hypothetical protein
VRCAEPLRLDEIREACAAVMERARSVRVEGPGLERLAAELLRDPGVPAGLDPAHHFRGSAEATLAYVVTLDAVNFGSGWFPHLRKRDGLSGYGTIASGLRERFEAEGPLPARALARTTAPDCARIFHQEGVPEVEELMRLFAAALRELGRFLLEGFAGRFEALVAGARGSAARLAGLLASMPFYRDVARYGDLGVPFYKRAQLTAADLHLAFGGAGPGRFEDLSGLTIFADNLVPHVLRIEGVLAYDAALAARIEAGELLAPGSPEEVEIRAGAVHAVEGLVAAIRRGGGRATARELDYRLWNRGQLPEIKARPRHRTRTVYY